MRKPIKAKDFIANNLTKSEARAMDEINKELTFCKTYAAELRDILYHCQQLAKAQNKLLVLTGKLNPEDRLAHQKQAENILLQTAFDAVY